MTDQAKARRIIEAAGEMLASHERLFLRQVLAGIALATGGMWDDLTLTFAHCIQ